MTTPYEQKLKEWQAAHPQGDGNPNDSGGGGWWGNVTKSPSEDAERQRKAMLAAQAAQAGNFASQGERGFGAMTGDLNAQRAQLQQIADGRLSYSKEALRQGLQQNQAAQRSMAAAAAPRDQAGAAHAAMMNASRLGYGMSGQAALAGIQEQQGAMKLGADLAAQQRQQDLMAALQSRQNAMTGYGAQNAGAPEKGFIEKYGPAIQAGATILAASDRRLKKNIDDADKDAKSALDGLKAYSYDYKDEKYGKGRQVGIMAQDLERSGLGHAVIDTPSGKMIHGGKLAGANTALLAALNKRVSKLEGGD